MQAYTRRPRYMDSLRPPLLVGYTDTCDSWDLVQPILLSSPFKVSNSIFPNLVELRLEFISSHPSNLSNLAPLIEQPLVHILLITINDVQTYRSVIKPLIQSWPQKFSGINCEQVVLVFFQKKIDVSTQKVLEKLKIDMLSVNLNKDRLHIIDSNKFESVDRFTNLIVNCLIAKRELLESSYYILFQQIKSDDIFNDFDHLFNSSENLASFYVQTGEYANALKVFSSLKVWNGFGFNIDSFLETYKYVTNSISVFNENLSACKVLAEMQPSFSPLYFYLYCLIMKFELNKLMGSFDWKLAYLEDCLDYVVFSGKLVDSLKFNEHVHEWLVDSLQNIIKHCSSLIYVDSNSEIPCTNDVSLFKLNYFMGLLYYHLYLLVNVKPEDTENCTEFLVKAIECFNLGSLKRFERALSILPAKTTKINEWDIWNVPYPPYLDFDGSDNEVELVKMPLPTLLYNGYIDTPIPLKFFSILPTDLDAQLDNIPVSLTFRAIEHVHLIRSNTLLPKIDCNKVKYTFESPLMLPEGLWILEKISQGERILFPKGANGHLTHVAIKITCPLSLEISSDYIDSTETPHWVCGFNNMIRCSSLIDPFEIVFPFPLKLIDLSTGQEVKDSESCTYAFGAGNYAFSAVCHLAEKFNGFVYMKSSVKNTIIKSQLSVIPLFEVKIRHIHNILHSVEVLTLRPVQVYVYSQDVEDKEEQSARPLATTTALVPFNIILKDKGEENQKLVIKYDDISHEFDINAKLIDRHNAPKGLGIKISAEEQVNREEPFPLRVEGSVNEAVACEFEDSDEFIICGWNRKVFLEEESDLLDFQVHLVPIGSHGTLELPSLNITKYPNDTYLDKIRRNVYVAPARTSYFKVTQLF